jgi:hypothetical protein
MSIREIARRTGLSGNKVRPIMLVAEWQFSYTTPRQDAMVRPGVI